MRLNLFMAKRSNHDSLQNDVVAIELHVPVGHLVDLDLGDRCAVHER